ncbi:BRO-N domain-containing protein [Serratia marcescens]|uniref:BRO-N domain-containing protein n=1 Tax=Serratia marcescens TaxID=615 RepID=UPI00093336E9|nr:Bro-N domain-containing protein [Serratia marcescens]
MSATAINPISFSFHETHEVRIQVIDGEPWFCLKDVCDILGIKNSSDLLSKQLDKSGVEKIYLRSGGQNRQFAFVNEPNLYRVIFRSNKPEAKQFQDWVFNEVLPTIRKTGRYEKQPAAEPLSPKDMSNLTRLVWLMTSGMKFDRAWSAGIWHCLRSVTGRASPQSFSVNDLPALGEECRRILKITSAFNSVIYDFEKEVIRTVVRRRGNIEPLVDKMKGQMVELLDNERSGLLSIDKICDSGVKELINRQ